MRKKLLWLKSWYRLETLLLTYKNLGTCLYIQTPGAWQNMLDFWGSVKRWKSDLPQIGLCLLAYIERGSLSPVRNREGLPGGEAGFNHFQGELRAWEWGNCCSSVCYMKMCSFSFLELSASIKTDYLGKWVSSASIPFWVNRTRSPVTLLEYYFTTKILYWKVRIINWWKVFVPHRIDTELVYHFIEYIS